MKINKEKIVFYLSIFYTVITGLVNIFGYFALPDKIATKFSFTGEITQRTPTPVYLVLSFAIILFLSIMGITKEGNQKVKYVIADSLIFVIHIVVVFKQI